MEFISIVEATQRYDKSLSTIKKAIVHAEDSDRKKGAKLNTGLYKTLISVGFFDRLFLNHSEPTENIDNSTENDYIKTLKTQLNNQQKTIDQLLHNQEQFLERQHEQNVLLERSTQRANLLEKHFNRNRTLSNDVQPTNEEIIIEEVIQEEKPRNTTTSDFLDTNDEEAFAEWIKTLNQ